MSPQTTPRWLPWLLRGLLLLVVTAAYLPSFRGKFVMDDEPWIVHSDLVQRPFLGTPLEVARMVRPVVVMSLWVNYHLGGLNVFGYHVVNFAVHVLAGWTLFGLVRRTLRLPPVDQRWAAWADWVAFTVALLWLIHPLQTQAVTYIIQRCESMMGLFYLLCLYFVLRGSQSPRPWPWYAAAALAGIAGMGSKESMVTIVVVLPLFDRIFLAPSWSAVVRRRWPVYLVVAAAAGWIVAAMLWNNAITAAAKPLGPSPDTGATRWEYLCSQPGVLLHYLRLAALPDRLCFDYRWASVSDWREAILPGSVVAALFIASLVALVYRPRIGFLAVATFLVLAPTSSFFPIADRAVEHRMYLPLAGLVVLAILALLALARRRLTQRQLAVLGTVSVLMLTGAWASRTFVRNGLYTRPLALWANVVEQTSNNSRAHTNLGSYLYEAGQLDAAKEQFERAIEISPTSRNAISNLARVHALQGNLDEALRLVRHNLTIGTPAAWIYADLGELLESRDAEASIVEYRRGLELTPRHPRTNYNLGRLLLKQGKAAEALPYLEVAAEEKPRVVSYQFLLALAYHRNGDFASAIEHYQRTLKIQPRPEAQRNLELARQGAPDELSAKNLPSPTSTQTISTSEPRGELAGS